MIRILIFTSYGSRGQKGSGSRGKKGTGSRIRNNGQQLLLWTFRSLWWEALLLICRARSGDCKYAIIRLPVAFVTVAPVVSCFETATWLWCCCDSSSSSSCWDQLGNVQRHGVCGGCCDVVRTVVSDAVMAFVMRSDGDCSDLELVGQYSI